MKKSLYNIVIFIFHIITIVLLFLLCTHFEIINLDFFKLSKDTFVSFLKNEYVVNIICTILTAIALYFFQIKYSKHKLKNDFRCNEIIRDVYDGIERTMDLIKDSKRVSEEVEELIETENMDFDMRRKAEAEKYLSFYRNHIGEFKICNICLTYHNNWILIDSVQTVFFINLNFKLLNLVNNIKNRRPNLEKEFPEIEKLYEKFKNNEDDFTLINLGYEIRHFLVDIEFMAKYWYDLLDYLGYDPMPIKLYMEIFKKEYPYYEENLTEFFKLPVSKQNKMSRKVKNKVAWIYFNYRIKNFFK